MDGSTYGLEGLVKNSDGSLVEKDVLSKNAVLNELIHNCVLCNDSKIVYDEVKNGFS